MLEGPGHADPVLGHLHALVRLGGRERPTGQQVVLVGGVNQASTYGGQEPLLPRLHDVDHGNGFVHGVGPHPRLIGVAAYPEGHHTEAGQFRELVGHAGQGVLQPWAIVEARAHHDLAVDGGPVVKQGPQPTQAGRPPSVAQHLGSLAGIGGVDADVQRTQALGHYPLQVGLGEPGQGGEVPVEERQPVVVVLHVQAAAEPGRKLVDEAELAVVVAGANPVEQGAVHLDTQGAPSWLFHVDLALQPSGIQSERHQRLVNE